VIELWDTSALILASRDPAVASQFGDALASDEVAISEPILLEYLNGARNLPEYDRFGTALGALRTLTTTSADWGRALEVHRGLASSGSGHQRSVRLVDLVIAAAAERHGVGIAHVDRDFDRIAAITGQRVRWVGMSPSAGMH